MLQSLKNLVVVLFIATFVFRLTKPIILLYCPEQDFQRRQKTWYYLTVAAFLSPSEWVYGALAIPVLLMIGRKDSNPAALYLFMLHVTPQVAVSVPLIGNLSTQFMLTISILVPAAFRLRDKRDGGRISGLQSMDWFLLGYVALTSILYIHQLAPDGTFYPSTSFDFLRRIFFIFLKIFVPFFVVSRYNCNRAAIVDSVAALWLPCVLMAAIAVFENLRGWLLYDVIPRNWGANGATFLMRGESLRAMASSGHPLALGYLLAVALGLWMYLQLRVRSSLSRFILGALLWAGQLAAYSRGPWICAIIIFFLFAAQKPGAASAVTKSLFVGAVVAAIVAISPIGKKIISVLPFFGGHVDSGNIDYRERLWDRGWDEILQSPFFGDQYVMTKLQDLRQGEGIIDFVNMYIAELLATGFVGLSLFLSVMLIGICSAWLSSRRIRRFDEDFSLLGGSLVSCLLGTLFLWGFGGPDIDVVWALIALAAAYAFIGQRKEFQMTLHPTRQGAASAG